MKVLFVGDVVGNPGRKILKELLPTIKREKQIDICIVNGENSAGGSGITYAVAQDLYKMGVDAITLGNHTFSKKEIFNFIDSDAKIARPANYPKGTAGRGSIIIETQKGKIGIINLLGRIFMDSLDCPFKVAEKEVDYLKKFVNKVVVDIHAEATSEKYALAWHLDGEVSCVVGTHTHVQTADERILPNGTGYITDVGMTGPYDGIIGVDRSIVINKFITRMPLKHEIAQRGKQQFNGVVIHIDDISGKTLDISRVMYINESF